MDDAGLADEAHEPGRFSTERFEESASSVISEVLEEVTELLSCSLQQAAANLVSLHKTVLLGEGDAFTTNGTSRCRAARAQRISLDDLDGLSVASASPSEDEGVRANARWTVTPPADGPVSAGLMSRIESKGSARPSVKTMHSMASMASSNGMASDGGLQTPPHFRSIGEARSEEASSVTSPADEARIAYRPFELHSLWKADDTCRTFSSPKNASKRKSMMSKTQQFRSGEEVVDQSTCHCCVMSPNSLPCLIWDVCCTTAIVHDMLMIPLTSAFPIADTGVTTSLALMSSCVWMGDLLLSFLRGYLDMRKGFVEMRLPNIAVHYVKTWFLPDVIMVTLDMLSLFLISPDLEVLTLLRMIRNLRILRFLKMTSRLAVLKETILSYDPRLESGSVYLETAATVLKQLAIIALLCHFVGCTWYAIGSVTSLGNTWVQEHLVWHDAIAEKADWWYLYVTSMHWALTQFTPAAMDVVAINTIERAFSLVVTLFGLIVFSFFIGSINQSLAKWRQVTAQELQQNQLVRRYINENGISVGLAAEVLTFIKQRGVGKATSKLVFTDIKVLEHLPRKLLSQMQEEVSMPVLQQHALFQNFAAMCYVDLARLCHKGLTEVSVVHGEELFQAGAPGERMYFVRGGRLSYFWEPRPLIAEDVMQDMRVSEASLWLRWEHRGRLICEEQSAHFFRLEASTFRKAISRSELMEAASIYARLFMGMMSDDFVESFFEDDEATDLFGSDQQVAELVKMLKSWQVGAVNVIAKWREDSLDLGTAFDAWREVLQSRKRQAARRQTWWRPWACCGVAPGKSQNK